MKNYCVEVEDNLAALVEKVNGMVAIGYKPVGGIYIQTFEEKNERKGYTERSTYYYQALFIDDGR